MSKKPKQPKTAPGVTQIVAGPCPTVTCDGKVWKIGFNTQSAKAGLEQLIRSHVLTQARADGPEEYKETRDLAHGGHYRTFEKGWLSILNSPDGAVLYLQSLLQKHHPEATFGDAIRLLSAEGDAVADALAEVSPNFFRVAAAEWAREKRVDETKAAAVGEEIASAVLASFQKKSSTAAPATVSD